MGRTLKQLQENECQKIKQKSIYDEYKIIKQEKAINEWLSKCPVDWKMYNQLQILLRCEKEGEIKEDVLLTPRVDKHYRSVTL